MLYIAKHKTRLRENVTRKTAHEKVGARIPGGRTYTYTATPGCDSDGRSAPGMNDSRLTQLGGSRECCNATTTEFPTQPLTLTA